MGKNTGEHRIVSLLGREGYAVLSLVGQPSDLYAFDLNRVPCWSGHVTSHQGSQDYWEKGKRLVQDNDRRGFQSLINEIFSRYPLEGEDDED